MIVYQQIISTYFIRRGGARRIKAFKSLLEGFRGFANPQFELPGTAAEDIGANTSRLKLEYNPYR